MQRIRENSWRYLPLMVVSFYVLIFAYVYDPRVIEHLEILPVCRQLFALALLLKSLHVLYKVYKTKADKPE